MKKIYKFNGWAGVLADYYADNLTVTVEATAAEHNAIQSGEEEAIERLHSEIFDADFFDNMRSWQFCKKQILDGSPGDDFELTDKRSEDYAHFTVKL
tara:strand:+ start:789 stop:1079 length:291 start_codon:yes stop_codon:yes gene_type:complete